MELDAIRERIDELDTQIVALWRERMALCAEAARVKAVSGRATLQQAREEDVLRRVGAAAGPLEEYAVTVYRSVLEMSRAYQDALRAGEDQK